MPPPSQCRVRTSECRLGHGKLPDIPHLHTKSLRIRGALLLSHGIQDLWVLLQLHGAFQKRALQAPNACPPTWPGSAALRRRPAPAARLEARRRGTPAEAAGRPRWPSARWPRSARRGLRSAAREEPLAGRPVTLARRAPAWRRSARPPARRCPRLLGGHTALVSGCFRELACFQAARWAFSCSEQKRKAMPEVLATRIDVPSPPYSHGPYPHGHFSHLSISPQLSRGKLLGGAEQGDAQVKAPASLLASSQLPAPPAVV